MRGLAALIMAGRWQAAGVAALAAFLALWLPPLFILSGAVLALVTLRRGATEGALVLALASLGSALLVWPTLGSVVPVQRAILLFWLPTWLLAVVLRSTVSLARALHTAVLLGGAAVLGFYLVMGSPETWWTEWLNEIHRALEQAQPGAEPVAREQLLAVIRAWAPVIPGLLVAGFVLSVLFGLFLGRWWQALLFNPGGFRQEFHELRLGQPLALITAALFAVVLITGHPLAANLALVLGTVYILQGIAVVHGVVARAGLSSAWLVAFYLLMILLLSQLVMVVGIIDAWVDFRSRVRPRT